MAEWSKATGSSRGQDAEANIGAADGPKGEAQDVPSQSGGVRLKLRRDGRVVECTGLEIRQGRKPLVGSNPTSSAIPDRSTLSCISFAWSASWPMIATPG